MASSLPPPAERSRPRRARRTRRVPTTGQASVQTVDVTRSFGDVEVIHPLSLEIEPGSVLGLIGPSGCGKTTTVRLMTGLLTPTSGTAKVFGEHSVRLSAAQRARIGYLPQIPALFPELSLEENLNFHASMYGLPLRRRARIDELLDWVELGEHRGKRVADSSGGMQRRLALAAAFVHDPDVLFLDEPTAGIDPILRDKLWTRFREVANAGKALIVTTQYVGEAGECDYVGLLSDGELLMLDTPEHLRQAAFEGEVIDVHLARPLSAEGWEQLARAPFVLGDIEALDEHRVRVVVDDADDAMDALGAVLSELGADVIEVGEHIVDYDEAFVKVVERHRAGLTGRSPSEVTT